MRRDLLGKTLGRYRIVKKIGAGGMGIVFEAVDEKLHRTVALKVLGDDVARDADRRQRFLREAQVVAGLTHPNIAAVYDAGETDEGEIYIAMELVAGASLRARIERGPIDREAAIAIARELTRALVKAHERGIVHRDLKPENVMVSDTLEVKVLDFGLAKSFAQENAAATTSSLATVDGRVLGTAGYMSPEQADGRVVDARTDVFALGVVLYEMTTGRRPFRGDSALEILIATARDEPPPPSAIEPAVSDDLERIILRCLEKHADARYANAGELATDLDALDAAPRHASHPLAPSRKPNGGDLATLGSIEHSAPVRRRIPAWLAASVLSLLGVVAVVGVRAKTTWTARSPSSPVATSLSDLPMPPSRNPELLSEYRAGIQALRDDDWGIAQSHFARVVELDPQLALGHLRVAMASSGTLDERVRREHYAKAVSLRAQLGDRDRAMLEAVEPVLQRAHEDRADAVTRLYRLRDLYPGDVEINVWLANLQHTPAGLVAADRAVALDPHDGQAWQSRGDILAGLGRLDDARAAYERCGTISPGSSECYLGLIWLEASEGRCEDAERAARRAVDRNRALASNLACVMVAAGRPVEAVREVLAQVASVSTGAPMWEQIDDARVAIFTGDLALARELSDRNQARADADATATFRDHLRPTVLLIGLAQESGDDERATELARSFAARSETWSKSGGADAGIDETLQLIHIALRGGALSSAELEARRTTWLAAARQSVAQPGLAWAYGYAAAADTREEAEAALAVLPGFAPLSSFVYYAGIPDAEIGNAYLLAGRAPEAVPYLVRAVAHCAGFRHPFVQLRAAMQLGRALEQTRDVRGACDAYRRVVARWGKARPRSLSAEAARARMTALSCAE